MRHYAGLDVSVKETSVCIIDESGKVLPRDEGTEGHPRGSRASPLHDRAWCLERVGLEAGPLSQWLFQRLGGKQGYRWCASRTRAHEKPSSRAQVNKSDRNDARGIAQMMRVNLFRPVHGKDAGPARSAGALLTARKLLQEKALAVDNDIRGPANGTSG